MGRRGGLRRWLVRAALLLATVLPGVLQAQTPEPPADARYAASTRGRVYYWIGCTGRWGRLSPANLVFFATAEAAHAAGYTPSRSAGCGRREETTSRPMAPGAPGADADASPALVAGTRVIARVIDGDTVECGGGERIRLLLIDAPELSQGPFGLRSRHALERLLPPGTPAAVELDVQRRDRYGRVLAHLYAPGGLRVTEEMVRQGYAVVAVYPPNVRYVDRFRRAAAAARRDGLGLWSESGFDCLPADRRRGRCER